MKHWFYIAILLVSVVCAAGEKTREGPSKHDQKQAQKSFQHAVELQKQGRAQEAFDEASLAASLVPGNMEYLTARELLRGQIAGQYIQRGNLLAEVGDNKGAASQFQAALAIDTANGYAQERLHDVSPPVDPEHEHILQLLASVDEVGVTPKSGKQNFHLKGDTRELYDAIGKAFDITITYDPALNSRRVRFDVDDVDFYAAMRIAGQVTATFWAPISQKRAIVATNTQEMQRQYQRLSMQTFYISNAVTPTDMNDIVNVMRQVFELRLVSLEAGKNTITVRGPKAQLAIISDVLDDLLQGRPEMLLDIKAYEVSFDKQRQMGLALPTDFTIFNVFAELYRVLGPAAKPIIDQLKSTGTIDPSKVPASALGQLQNSPLLQPFIFFGKGYGLTGITVSSISGRFRSTSTSVKTLEHVTMHAASGDPATFRIGTRFPIQTSSFTNVSISNQGLPVVGSPLGATQYEDLGLTFKATPSLQKDDNVTLKVELEIKGLGGQQINGNPVITNRAYSGTITVKDGEPSVVAGSITEQWIKTNSGYPGIGQVPLLSNILNSNTRQHSRSEILVVVTPHIIRKAFRNPDNLYVLGR